MSRQVERPARYAACLFRFHGLLRSAEPTLCAMTMSSAQWAPDQVHLRLRTRARRYSAVPEAGVGISLLLLGTCGVSYSTSLRLRRHNAQDVVGTTVSVHAYLPVFGYTDPMYVGA